ncbi:hematopoietic prostaglandin D synthase isoform X3 [Eptesicus fuscus]|uniref:hematopoietic prostaglandin D synthase isoform X3 n=1 Tax=Eptesicus fuscus TaxID=29078 RepID=UPI00240470B8|nr:hematopoietic prostaglandin D synthase isoform X3 [Eptesicus fuscus]
MHQPGPGIKPATENYTMPSYKLIYFNMRGRAEIIRYIFAYLDIKYEDHRIEQADWPKIKPTLPFGKIPILEVDGLNLHQSLAIARYLTKNTDLAGKTELEQCQVDAIVDTLDDFMSRFPWAEKKQDIREQMFNELLTYDAPHLLQDLDTYLGEKEWFIGNSEQQMFHPRHGAASAAACHQKWLRVSVLTRVS